VWLKLPGYWTSSDLARAAVAEGLAVTPADVFCIATAPNAIRISLGSIKDRRRLASGLRRLSELLARRPRTFNDAII
jgi:DNA-binding transcriptional MocR family regulator